jgi:hypothetical protein
MSSRAPTFIRLLKWPTLLALTVYLVSEVLTDRVAVLQWIWWIPRPVLAGAALAWLMIPAAVCLSRRDCARERRVLAWVAGVSLVALLHGTLQLWGFSKDRPMPSVRIVHWNASYPADEEVAEWIVDAIIGLDADVVVMTDPGMLIFGDRADRFAAAKYEVYAPGRFAVLARARVMESTPLVASKRGSASRIVVETREGVLAIRAIDLPSDPRLSRMATAGELAATIAAADASTPDVILGDFNITGGSASLTQFGVGYRDSFADAGTGWGGTYPRARPLWRIDLTLVRPPWRTVRAEIIDLYGKRHRAQVIDLVRDSDE